MGTQTSCTESPGTHTAIDISRLRGELFELHVVKFD